VLLGGGALFIYRTRSADLERARNDALTELTTARRDLKAAQGQLAARDAASEKAYAFYQLVRDGKRADALAQYVDVSQLALSPTEREVFADGAKQARAKMVDAGWQSGLEAFHKGDFAKAVTELRRAANYESGGANTPQLHYYLGVALVKTKDPNGAIDELQAALAAKVDETADTADARYWLAVALEGAGKPDQARREYEKFAAAQPMAPMAAMARQRWVVIGQQLAAKKAP
jgi:tetratricopeptide (TPR) repeat protein